MPRNVGINPVLFPKDKLGPLLAKSLFKNGRGGSCIWRDASLSRVSWILLRGENEETEEVELPIDDVIEADQALFQPGTYFGGSSVFVRIRTERKVREGSCAPPAGLDRARDAETL